MISHESPPPRHYWHRWGVKSWFSIETDARMQWDHFPSHCQFKSQFEGYSINVVLRLWSQWVLHDLNLPSTENLFEVQWNYHGIQENQWNADTSSNYKAKCTNNKVLVQSPAMEDPLNIHEGLTNMNNEHLRSCQFMRNSTIWVCVVTRHL